jgi:hypothetical protein
VSALRREHAGAPSPVAEGPRAKSLRIGALRAETRAALGAFESAARDWESARAARSDDAPLSLDDRFLRSAAASVLDALVRDLRDGRPLPKDLADDVARWIDGEFAGSDADVEVANHALYALLGSDVLAEIARPAD